MDIRHRLINNGIWIECYNNEDIVAWVKFILYDNNTLRSSSTMVLPSYRGAKLANQMYLYAYNLGYKIRPSPLQTNEGRLMWKKFRESNQPFVQWTKWQRFIKWARSRASYCCCHL